jgi:hypothetical protein
MYGFYKSDKADDVYMYIVLKYMPKDTLTSYLEVEAP